MLVRSVDPKSEPATKNKSPVETAKTTAAAPTRPSGFLVPAGRSPIPQPGETFGTPIKAGEFVERKNTAAPAPPPTGIVPWHQADRYVGQTITAEGAVINTHSTGKVCFLNFARDWRGQFYVVIFSDALGGWDQPPQTYFLNRKVQVTGQVYLHDGRPQIRVKQPGQITLVTD
jgi:hypothetical protein